MKQVRSLFERALGALRSGGMPRAAEPAAPALDFNPQDPAFIAEPYPVYAALRERDPLHRTSRGVWVLSRHPDIVAALADRRFGNAPSPFAVVNGRNRERYVCADVANNIVPFLDPPAHTLPRKILARVFHEHTSAHPVDIETLAEDMLRSAAARGEFDLLGDFATPLSVRVLCRLLGLPESDHDRLVRWSEYFFYLFTFIPSEDIRARLDAALREFRAYVAEVVALRRAHPGNDLISALLAADRDGERLTDAQLIDNCMLLFADGVENVDAAIANAVYVLLRHPEQWRKLCAQPELIPAAVDECLRYDSPAQFIGRVAREDVELHGKTIRMNEAVLLLLASANRDPAALRDPDRFDITRRPNPHLGFGKGRHACIGGRLVETELRAVLALLARTTPGLRLITDTPRWAPRLGHRWMEELRVATS